MIRGAQGLCFTVSSNTTLFLRGEIKVGVPAGRAKLRSGDIILPVDDVGVATADDLLRMLGGDRMPLCN